ncbi:Fatty acid hydroxylase superfamily protein [Tsuneonella dongtanensis]|uniref:Fatty acid hydroxylase superfamily protein n=1 Tax=Tsuneonella dongtanensis TaxID=692370 RepID=A0A1B2AH22_9SPHN|nr:sterol desaturase family protein [Tsuneonella dongtanensis]ANY21408.1 Fatty acid hydroxylase superfamily protein [Tsuneonella dongtanensis]
MLDTGFVPLDVLSERGLEFFTFDFVRYLIAAGSVSVVIWVIARSRFAGRRIQTRHARWSDRRREVLQSIQAVAVYAVVGSFVFWGVQEGVLQRLDVSYSWPAYLGLAAAMIVAHDAYFYWVHRAMHHRLLFRWFHLPHHRSITPTPWAAYSFAIPEALVMALFAPLWLFFVPTPGEVVLAWLMFQIFRNAMGHAGFELHPRWWLSTPLTRWINTTTHHDLHHSGGFNKNYGLYFTWWDKLMGTEHPRYAETFAKVTGRGAPSGNTATESTVAMAAF